MLKMWVAVSGINCKCSKKVINEEGKNKIFTSENLKNVNFKNTSQDPQKPTQATF